jgi:hypothetical protein
MASGVPLIVEPHSVDNYEIWVLSFLVGCELFERFLSEILESSFGNVMGFEIPDVGFEVGELEIDVSDKSELKLIVEGLDIETKEEDVVILGHFCIDGPG